MTIRLSTGMTNKLLDGGTTGGIKGAFGGYMGIFAGSQPADADSGSGSAVLLGTVTNNDDGTTTLSFDATVAGTISKAAAQNWKFHGLTNGVAGWWMLYQTGDSYTGSSASYARITGTIGTAGADVNISNTSIVTSAVTTIDTFTITLPKA
jgi:hypothetical protein